ncbi:hypothetical protein QR680_003726 [Steinernema hermaphroditum]|uniref:7TM GPCR serpentine receptor class x (Srx) domain-containing protein n=1 Tax=Steinernema hermaphroditum TaxID=289476 RepID=A0AA39LSK1_9BILA|nr:hypothetical protein QR680_003726 [Steinernema hermaphroditum]
MTVVEAVYPTEVMSANTTLETTDSQELIFQVQGALFVALVVLSLPLNFRILHIFLSKPSYRNEECYQIMIHIGIAQCLFAPGVLFQGIMKLLNHDVYHLASLTVKAHPPVSRAEALMQLALALNRLKLICKLKYPSAIHTILIIIAWLFGFSFLSFYFLFSEYVDLTATPDKILPYYDLSKPFSTAVRRAAAGIIVVTSSLTFIVYCIIFGYILYVKKTTGQTFKSYKEKSILIFASTRFLFDMMNAFSLLYRPFADDVVLEFFLSFGYPFNYLWLPPILYLSMHREVRRQLLPWKKVSNAIAAIKMS